MSENIKFCKDCKFFVESAMGLDMCRRITRAGAHDLITGNNSVSVQYCQDERYSFKQKSCGKKAKFFEPNMKYKVITFVKNIFKHG